MAVYGLIHQHPDTRNPLEVVSISDAFEERRAQLLAEVDQGADPEHPDEYRAENIFWVPKEARWAQLQAKAKQPIIGKLIDDAMVAIERDNPSLKGVLPKEYARPGLDKQRLGELIDLIGTIRRRSSRSSSIWPRTCARRRHAASSWASPTTSWPSTRRWASTTRR